jgi:Reverse transcriptase (RNA-dependent DNA polymerase)
MKAKTRWYNEDERSNKYLLNLLKRNNESSEMSKLNINGIVTTIETEIRKGVTEFYIELYNNDNNIDIDNDFLNVMFTVQQHFQDNIHAPITLDEMWNTIKSIRATTPGPDGISNLYIKKLWYILGPIILEAWNYSITTNNLPPSHKTSLLRLIPKRDKDTTLIKNWRPITLSTCDHKLITRLYNNRILKAIEKEITNTQTAYIKGRNISDNLRLLGAAVRLADNEDDINAIVIALDAQKAFDSVNHQYISSLLQITGLHNFIPIFQLLYKDLRNDIIINGKIGSGYKQGNGVKQGDALSCSLFILAMEPLLRNIAKNSTITLIKSRTINFTWPKIIGYEDDVTIITENTNNSVKQIFHEYERLTRSSGLKLNADKNEELNITSHNVVGALAANNVTYGDTRYLIQAQD